MKNLIKKIDIFFRPYIYGKVKIGKNSWSWHKARIDRKTDILEHWYFTWHEPTEWDNARDFTLNKKKYKRVRVPFET